MKSKKTKVPPKVAAAFATAAASTALSGLFGTAIAPMLFPLGDLVSVFLHNTSHLHGVATHEKLVSGLKYLAAHFGHQPIGQVTSQQIEHIIDSNQCWGSRTRQQVLRDFKVFFHWARHEGQLPQHLPTAADLVNLHIKALPPQSILAPGLGQLLQSTRDPDILMPTVLFAFAGPLVVELQRLNRDAIRPGHSIILNLDQPGEKRLVHITAVLDAWLAPFYGYPDLPFLRPSAMKKFRRWARAQNLPFLPRILRNSFIAHLLEQSGDLHRTALETGLRMQFCHKFLTGLVARGSARNYFSFTPAKVGLRNWPRMVREYMAQNSRQRRVKNP